MKDILDFISAALPWICIGLSLGMLAGLVIGSCIEKKKSDDEE